MEKIIGFCICILFFTKGNSQNELWGMTLGGGQFGYGVIFKTAGDGTNHTIVKSFSIDYEGSYPLQTKLCKAADGKLYGMTKYGGTNGLGVLFGYDPINQVYSKKMDFSGTINGSKPNGGLIQAANGKLYGMTNLGGANGLGALIEYDLSNNTCTIKHNFGGVNGSQPYGSLFEATNGKLYGMTPSGGASNKGVLFEFDINTGIFTKKIDFDGPINGAGPYGGNLMQASNGKLYGMCSEGGANNKGVLFEYDLVTNSILKKMDFDGNNTGSSPNGSLVELNNKLYGMTTYGGLNNKGVLFDFDFATSIYTKHRDFSGISDGSYPYGDLALAPSGKLYAMTQQGGANNYGVVFEYDPVTSIYLKQIEFNGFNGMYPQSTLLLDGSGKFYSVTAEGGIDNGGVIFEYDPAANTYNKHIDLNGDNGRYPSGGLIRAGNGKLYGMTMQGGKYDKGVIFEYDPISNLYINKFNFNAADGASPSGSLFEANNGKLYGMTTYGGVNNAGVIFEYNPAANIYIKKWDFSSTSDGSGPIGNLIQSNNGKLYGMTRYGGTSGKGTIVEYDIATNVFAKKVDFTGTANGQGPVGSLIQANNNKLYGMTEQGGTSYKGVLFEYDPMTNTYTKKIDFVGTANGSGPTGSLINSSSGKLYGMTNNGGANSLGVIYEYDPNSNIYIKKFDFSGTNGAIPYGSLTEGYNGKLYGMTNQNQGGSSVFGTIFEFDQVSNVFTKRFDFNVTTGRDPRYSALLGICTPPSAPSGAAIQNLCIGDQIASLNASGLNINWYSSATNTIVISPTVALVNGSHYFASQTNGCESSRLDVLVNLNSLPTITVNSGAICTGQSFTITPTGANTYTYSGGNNIVSPLVDSSYSVTGTDSNGCVSLTPVVSNVTVNPLPFITANDGVICNGQSFTITPGGAVTYTYSGGTDIVSPSSDMSYSVTGTDSNGCVSLTPGVSDVTVNPLPFITANDGVICNGQSFTITPGGAVTYTYSGGTDIVSPSSDMSYSITGTDSNGCESLNAAVCNVTVNALPVITASASNSLLCVGETVTLTASGATTYMWSTSENSAVIVVSPTINIVYSVSATDANNCTNAALVTLSVSTCTDIKSTAFDIVNPLIFPNPISGILNISFNSVPQNAKIEVYNSIGALVLSETMSNRNNTIRIDDLSNGMYFVKVLQDGKVVEVKKVIKE